MPRERTHDYPASMLLVGIGTALEAKRTALEAILADLAKQDAEQTAARELHQTACLAATGHRWDTAWEREHPSPPWDACITNRQREANEGLADLERWGTPCSLAAFTGRIDLTRSAKVAIGLSVKELVAAGLVETFGCTSGKSIRLTPAGWARLAELTTEAAHG